MQEQESKEYKDKWISTSRYSWSTPGTYLDLSRKDSLYETLDFDFKHIRAHKYHLDSLNNMYLDDTAFFGKVIKHTENILLIQDSFETNSFIPIKNYNLEIDANEIRKILLANDWQLSDESSYLRIEFTNAPWVFNPEKLSTYFIINESKGWEYNDAGWWTIENYRNSYFIILSHGQRDYQHYQIKSVSDSLIITETCWTDSVEEAVFSIYKKLDNDKYNKLEEKITGNWKLIDYFELIDSSGIPITRFNRRCRPFDDGDSVPMILNKYYVLKSISYEFLSDGSCLMKSNDKTLRTAKWTLSKDGKYIKTSDGWMRSMKINSISDSVLVIEKHEIIEYLDDYNFKDKYIHEKLKK